MAGVEKKVSCRISAEHARFTALHWVSYCPNGTDPIRSQDVISSRRLTASRSDKQLLKQFDFETGLQRSLC